MTDYRLDLLIDPQDLAILRAAGQRITLGKATSAPGSPNVVWLAFDPFQSNTVQWSEDYGLYVSTTSLQQGAMIAKLSEVPAPAQDGASYSFTAAATFNGPFSGGTRGTYSVRNDMPYNAYPVLTFGLTQPAAINQQQLFGKPLSATPVLATQTFEITPSATVYVWLQSQFGSQTIITRIIGRTTIVRFGGDVTAVTLKYDPNLGVFVAQPGSSKAQGEASPVELLLPVVH